MKDAGERNVESPQRFTGLAGDVEMDAADSLLFQKYDKTAAEQGVNDGGDGSTCSGESGE